MEESEIERLRQRLLAESFPRLQMTLIVSLAGLGAFLCSATLLHAGLGSMAARYFLAAAVGYLLFLVLVRVWLSYQGRRWSRDLDVPIEGGSDTAPEAPSFSGGGGSFGGGGASGTFRSPVADSHSGSAAFPTPDSEAGRSVLDAVPDFDEAWPVAFGVAALFGGIVALAFVVYASPILFAEVLLDAAVVGTVYHRARRRRRRHWLQGVLRRTWLPAAALCLFVGAAGFALQAAAPEAQSLGAVLRSAGAR